jgi:lipopolysaccharide/colanic/teichoic acid biosynthesis glycosyltransferase
LKSTKVKQTAPKIGAPERGALPDLLSSSEFERMVQRERELADRHHHGFAVVVFVEHGQKAAAQGTLATLLLERIRFCDFVGRLDGERLAALLPCTSGAQAWVLADDILKKLAHAGLKFDCKVLSYPSAQEARDVPRTRKDDDEGGTPPEDSNDSRPSRPEKREAAPTSETTALSMSHIRDAAGVRPVSSLDPELVIPLSKRKRALDIVVAGGMLVALSPLFAVVAALIKLTSPGPVIFKQMRAGKGGRPFAFYKFRSMYLDAEARKAALRGQNEVDGPIFKMKNDPRITPVGRTLRKWSIDELPQLWNVLNGDMTLVGPRPPTLDEVESYEPWQRRRLSLTGGLTCIWQVSGRSQIGFEDWMRMDSRYARHRSLRMDLKILAQTAGAVLARRGAY